MIGEGLELRCIDQISSQTENEPTIYTKATILATRRTRIKRINADFDHTFGAIGIR